MRHSLTAFLAALTLLASGAAAGAASLKTTDSGVQIDAGTTGQYTLEYPQLLGTDQKVVHKLLEKQPAGKEARLKYHGGARIELSIKDDGTLAYVCAGIPEDVKYFQTRMALPPAPLAGGSFSFNNSPLKAFPANKPAKPHLFQGQATTFSIQAADGKAITLVTPFSFSYSQLTDNREWNWNTFQWQCSSPYNPDVKTYTMRVLDGVVDPKLAAPRAQETAASPKPAPVPTATAGQGLSLSDKGIVIGMGTMGSFTLEYPQLLGKDQKVAHKLIEKQRDATAAVLKYEGGGQINLELKGGDVVLSFRNIADDVTQYSSLMLLDFSLASGGTWKVAGQAAQPFPAEKPAKPHLYQGSATTIIFAGYDGRSFAFTVPEYSYLQLTDNREWGWKTFAFRFNSPLSRDAAAQRLHISLGAATASLQARPQVDRFGQNARMDWPDKVKSEEELKSDVASEKEYYASFNPPKLDTYGGLPGSGQKLGLRKTGFFHVEQNGGRWYLVDPEGNAFFHLAIGCFQPASYTYVAGRESIYEWLPPRSGEFASAWMKQDPNSVDFHLVNEIRKYGKAEQLPQWLERFIYRVRQFGFNSGGPFTGSMSQQPAGANFPYVGGLPLNQWNDGIKRIPGVRETWDPFDPTVVARIEKHFAALEKNRDNPLLIGYFIINEPLYEDIPKVVPTLNGKWACKRELVSMLQKKYGNIAAFNQAWNMKAADFDELVEPGLPVTTRSASEDMQAYTLHFLDTLMSTVCGTARKYDPNHMIIGNRLQSGTINNEPLCRLFGKYLDVMSFNYYTYYLDKDFLDRIYGWTGRPMFLSEFYWNSARDSGLPGGVKDVGSQLERGLGYRNYVEQAAATPYVLGIEWFTLIDESITGNWFSKYGGENGNTGLFSVADRPYKPMIAEMVKTNYDIYKVMQGERKPFRYDDPRFNQAAAGQKTLKITRAAGPIKVDGAAANWPGIPAETISSKRLVEGNSAGGVEASFKTCWDDQNLYILVNVVDPTPMKNSHDKPDGIWAGDAVELFIGADKVDQGGTLLFTDRQILLSAAMPGGQPLYYFNHAPDQPQCQMTVVPNVDGKGYTLEAAIPFSALAIKPAIGTTFRFDLSVDDSEDGARRLRQLAWNGTNRNSGDRTNWGKAVLSQ